MRIAKEWVLLGVLAALFVVMSIGAPHFLTLYNLQNMAAQMPEFAILAMAMMVVLLTAGIDLSITYTASMSGIVTVLCLSHYPLWLGVLAGLVTAILCGALNGVIVAYLGVSPILVTLGTMTLFQGLGQWFTKGRPVSGFPEAYEQIGNGTIGAVPVPMILMIIVAILLSIVLQRTRWGRSVYMVGSNPTATLFSGIDTRKVLLLVYMIAGGLAGLAAMIMTSRYNSASYDLGNSYLLQSISAAVLGGTEISGGVGSVPGVLLGVAIFQVLSNGLQLSGVPPALVDALTGMVLIVVLLIHRFTERKRRHPGRVRTAEQGGDDAGVERKFIKEKHRSIAQGGRESQ